MDLFNAAAEEIKGEIGFQHAYIDFSKHEVTISNEGAHEVANTCPAAMGFAFAAGTTDGPGALDLKQGDDKVISVLYFLFAHYLFLACCLNMSWCVMLIIVLTVHQGSPFWKLIRNLVKRPNKEQIDCQHPKPILLDAGEMTIPYDWAVSYSLLTLSCPDFLV